MKNISITKTKTHYWIYPLSTTTEGLLIATDPFIKLDLNISEAELINTLQLAFDNCKANISPPKDWGIFNKEFVNKLETKSLKNFYKEAILCEVFKTDVVMGFLPTLNVNGKGEFDHLTNFEIKISTSASNFEILSALKKAFDNCK